VITTVEARLKTFDSRVQEFEAPDTMMPVQFVRDEDGSAIAADGSAKRKRGDNTNKPKTASSSTAKKQYLARSFPTMRGHTAFLTFGMKFSLPQNIGGAGAGAAVAVKSE
jgi:hypothetical protein